MTINLSGKVALVTGSSRGIGKSIALSLGRAGARVALTARHSVDLKCAELALRAEKIKTFAITTDLTARNAPEELVRAVVKKWGRLDILVNNVGGLPKTGAFSELREEDWRNTYQLNVMTVVSACKAAIPHLKRSDAPRIINISSVVATEPGEMNPHYSASKAAVLNLTKHLSRVLAPDRILVNAVSPGIIFTEGWGDYLRTKAREEGKPPAEVEQTENQRAARSMALGRLGDPQEVAHVVVFLASSEASFITGRDFAVDGGKLRSI